MKEAADLWQKAYDSAGEVVSNMESTTETQKNTQGQETEGGVRYSIAPIKGEKGDYGMGVILDTDLFKGVHPRNWNRPLREFVYKNLAGREMVMYDQNGNQEIVHLAKKNDTVKKDGANNSHKVIDKLARANGDNIRALATAHTEELLEVADPNTQIPDSDHTHQWMDENGWKH